MRAEIAQLNGNANFSLFREIFIESSWRKAKSLSSKKLFRDFTVIIQTRASGDVTCVCSDMFESWSSWVRLGQNWSDLVQSWSVWLMLAIHQTAQNTQSFNKKV